MTPPILLPAAAEPTEPIWKSSVQDQPGIADTSSSAGGRLDAAGFTDRGPTRDSNEDRFRVEPDLGLLVLADGMSGHSDGDVAAAVATATVVECLRHPSGAVEPPGEPWPFGFDATLSTAGNRLRTAFQMARLRLVEASLIDPALAGMGTTMVAAVAEQGRLAVAWSGDSRLYVNDSDGFRQITHDDPRMGTTSPADVHAAEVVLTLGMVVALTTDGVHGSLQDRHIAHLLSSREWPAHAAADLVASAMGAGSTDNCTAIVARWAPADPSRACSS